MLRALVIDDELFARDELATLLVESGLVDVIDQANNAICGLKKIHELRPDVIFVDIEMPQISGIDLLAMLDPQTMPQVVFVTAFDHYAIQAFEDNAFDYLLKPVAPCRLHKTLTRLEQTLALKHRVTDFSAITPSTIHHIPCMGHNRIVVIPMAKVECVYSDISGVHVLAQGQKGSTPMTLKVLEEKTELVRCHRQYLVAINAIEEIKLFDNGVAEITTRSKHQVPVSRRYLKRLKELLGVHC
ncbi:two-component system response regulator BtsR [Vibrio sp. SM6]|uniref:Two-component system response regulator BtsR n=1 Tax=Vibrio agarilyticus TaxID=2726741 RepID=A0A7X8TNU9_9VIBR|nr:two-component system response regulator BtsR [Vibrio agarilyticus]NLS11969.1 two-component system response regulator BtsR [Vibrio agarilyticus]